MSLRLSEEQLQAINQRREQWEREGRVTVRTVRASDVEPQRPDLMGAPPEPPPTVVARLEQRKRTASERGKMGGRPKKPPVLVIPEKHVLSGCLKVLELHPKVAFAWRQNTGLAMGHDGRTVRFSVAGCSDILGVLSDGRFMAVECKRTGKTATPEQQAFLDQVRRAGGFSICVDDPAKLAAAIDDEHLYEPRT